MFLLFMSFLHRAMLGVVRNCSSELLLSMDHVGMSEVSRKLDGEKLGYKAVPDSTSICLPLSLVVVVVFFLFFVVLRE